MKKVITTLLLTAAMTVLCACGQDGTEPEKDTSGDTNTESSEVSSESPETESGQTEGYQDITLDDVLNHAETPAEEFEVVENDHSVTIVEYTGSDPIVVVPEEINGKPVTVVEAIMKQSPNTSVSGVRFSDSVVSFSGFMNDSDIQYVICGAGVLSIPENCFMGCNSLKAVQMNEGLESIGNAAFCSCPSLTELYIPESVTEFGWDTSFAALDNCTIHVVAGSPAESWLLEKEQNGAVFPNWVAE